MKIAIIGPGAMGLFFAARLQEAGQEVWVLDYRPERADSFSSIRAAADYPGR